MGIDLAGEAPAAPGASRCGAIESARDTLFTSGTLGRYSKMLTAFLPDREPEEADRP
jgi:hypothetical protein